MENNTQKGLGLLFQQKKKLIKWAVMLVLLLVVILVVFFRGYSSATDKYEQAIAELEAENKKLSDPVSVVTLATTEVSIDLINSEIKEIGELATVEYMYTDAGKFESAAELFGKEVPFKFTTKSFIAKWDGEIKAGIDITKVTAEENKAGKEIIVHIPKAQILSHEIDNSSIETLDEKDGLFNPVKVEDVRIFDEKAKEEMEKRAIENGILDKALENAKVIISGLINTGAVKELEYTITFDVME